MVVTAQDWIETAERHLSDARMLKDRGGSPEAIFNYAGMTVECGLKALIMKRQGWNTWPSQDEARIQGLRIYVHSLRRLAKLAGVHAELEHAKAEGLELGGYWGFVSGWDYNRPRFPSGAMPRPYALDMFRSVAHHRDGVFTWLLMKFQRG